MVLTGDADTGNYKLVAFDIDGTLTIDRTSVRLSLAAIQALIKLEEHGIMASLISGNMLPVVAGLKRYLGLSGPAIGETGCIVYFDERNIDVLTKYSTKNVAKDIVSRFGEYIYESWQNMFRFYDFALKIKKEYRHQANEIYLMIKMYVEQRYDFVKVGFSGYAIHLTPIDAGKAYALKYIMEKLGLSKDEVIGVGDSILDYDFMKEAGLSVAVANADEELKKNVAIVLSKPSGEGVAELVEMIISGKI